MCGCRRPRHGLKQLLHFASEIHATSLWCRNSCRRNWLDIDLWLYSRVLQSHTNPPHMWLDAWISHWAVTCFCIWFSNWKHTAAVIKTTTTFRSIQSIHQNLSWNKMEARNRSYSCRIPLDQTCWGKATAISPATITMHKALKGNVQYWPKRK